MSPCLRWIYPSAPLILNLLKDLQAELGLAYLFISHDIHTVHYFCSRTAVVFHGRLMEVGDTETLISYPEHPYTKALLSSRLSVDPEVRMEEYSLKGDPRSPTSTRPGMSTCRPVPY